MHVSIGLRERSFVRRQAVAVAAQECLDALQVPLLLGVIEDLLDRYEQRRVGDEAHRWAVRLDEAAERVQVIASQRLTDPLSGLSSGAVVRVVLEPPAQVLRRQPRVPHCEVAGVGEFQRRLAVGARRRFDGRGTRGRIETELSAGDLDARGEPLDIPLDRSRQALIEVVEPKDQRALRGLEHPEVGEMCVAAQLSAKTPARRVSKVRGHHGRGAAEEREGRRGHSAVADWNQLRHARLRLDLEKLYGVTA